MSNKGYRSYYGVPTHVIDTVSATLRFKIYNKKGEEQTSLHGLDQDRVAQEFCKTHFGTHAQILSKDSKGHAFYSIPGTKFEFSVSRGRPDITTMGEADDHKFWMEQQ